MLLYLVQIAGNDSTALKIPSFTDRLNFTLPVIVILFMVMFFLVLKSYAINNAATRSSRMKSKRDEKKAK